VNHAAQPPPSPGRRLDAAPPSQRRAGALPDRSGPWLTLGRLFVLGTLGIALAVAVALFALLESSRQSILARSDTLRESDAQQVGAQISDHLGVASRTLAQIERAMQVGVLDASSPDAVEARLFAEVLDNPMVSDITLTRAKLMGYNDQGEAVLAPDDRWQVVVFRTSGDPASPVYTRRIQVKDSAWINQVRRRPAGGGLLSASFRPEPNATDPTAHPTFSVTASREYYGKAIWSDLAWSELDLALPEAQRRVVVSVQKAVDDMPGRFAGVLRVGLLTRAIDALPAARSQGSERVLLCDDRGRLVARLAPGDKVQSFDDELRIVAAREPPEVAAALARAGRSGGFVADGVRYLVTFQGIANSQGWMTAILVPQDFYTHDLRALRDKFLGGLLAVTLVVLAGGWLVMRKVRSSLRDVVEATRRMRGFDFAPLPARSGLREIADVLDGLERAKTSVRALGRYVPVDLVRQLYEANRDPELGGELVAISLMFTDIEGFTSLSETLSPDALARALGQYLQAMTKAVRSTGGTVDKFIGDAVMAFWNAPLRVEDHSVRACRAALQCIEQTRALYASPDWRGLPALFTRFGLHTATAMVGNFGSQERLSYTALGDGVNLASRLEGLCKQYDVGLLASEATVKASGDAFVFRRLDKVAVKGRKQWVQVYELLGKAGACDAKMPTVRTYEAALDAYLARDFRKALAALEVLTDDPPSQRLADRCRDLLEHPPPEDWDGVYVATNK
jgi:adenylate cyclase